MSVERFVFESASFRGIAFGIRGDGHDGGHQIATHSYFISENDEEQRSHYDLENTGRAPESHNINGYLHSPDLDQKRRDMIEAFRDRSPGTLYHPFWNEDIQVRVTRWSFRPTKDRLGVVEFSFTVIRDGDGERAPRQARTPLARLPFASQSMEDAAVSDFESNYDLSSAQGFSALAVVDDWNRAIDFILQTVSTHYVAGIGEIVGVFNGIRGVIKDGRHGAFLRDAMERLAFLYDDNDAQGAAVFSRIVNMGLPLTSNTSQQGQIQNNNTLAVEALVNRLALSHFAGFAINTDYDNQNDAHARRSEFANAVLAEQTRSSENNDTASYVAASELLALTGSEFSDITDILQPLAIDDDVRSGTALSLAWKYYRDPTRASELMVRNFVLNGAFMPPNVIYVTS